MSEQENQDKPKATITRLLPRASDTALNDDDIAALYAADSDADGWMRVNFVSSVDGAGTHEGLSAGLSGDADHRVFDLLRTLCDVVVVGAGTVRAEGYGPMRVDDALQQRRVGNGLQPQPVFALVSSSLNLDPNSRIFTDAPVRPIVVTGERAPADARAALDKVADVLVCGDDRVDTVRMRRALIERGLTRIHGEGGPHLFGTMVADGAFDELCLTLSGQLEGGHGIRITGGVGLPEAAPLRLAHVLASDDTLLLRYLRA